MGNMEEKHMENAASSTTTLHKLSELWKSPRGTVLRIESLALAAIALSFVVVAFGFCRRWSNHWIIQKGFLAANVLSMSLGTYSIGVMQSSSVRSEMYAIWSVSLFTVLSSMDPVTSYIGLDYRSSLLKMVFQICLYGYVLLMSISTTCNETGSIAICMLSAITFIKGFHRSLALVLPSRLRGMVGCLRDGVEIFYLTPYSDIELLKMNKLIVDFPPALDESAFCADSSDTFRMIDILDSMCQEMDSSSKEGDEPSEENNGNDELSFQDVSMAFSLSHLLQRHFLGLSRTEHIKSIFTVPNSTVDYRWALKLIEVELAFLYETFFTSNAFLHHYQAKASSLWTFASFIGICFVIHGTMTGCRNTTHGPGAGTSNVLHTTTADLIITLVILVSLALLQLVLLLRSWTSNWARVTFACECSWESPCRGTLKWWWRRLKATVLTRINWFDKYRLWQGKLGQYSIVEGMSKGGRKLFNTDNMLETLPYWVQKVCKKCAPFLWMFGLQYIGQVLWELRGSKTKVGASVRLHADVKASIADFLDQIKDDTIGDDWFFLFLENGVVIDVRYYDVFVKEDQGLWTACLLKWHIATCYCELAEQEQEDSSGCTGNAVASTACFKKPMAWFFKQKDDVAGGEAEKNRRVAIALSNYYAYLVVSAPELLPGPSASTTYLYDQIASEARIALQGAKDKLQAMQRVLAKTQEHVSADRSCPAPRSPGRPPQGGVFLNKKNEEDVHEAFRCGVQLGKQLALLPTGVRTSVLHSWFPETLPQCGVFLNNKNEEDVREAFWRGVPLGKQLFEQLLEQVADNGGSKKDEEDVRMAFGRGVELGKQLFHKMAGSHCSDHWKVLALFWVQALVYISPYGNVEAHRQHLSQGGEFITHLWALLYHLGIYKLKPANLDEILGISGEQGVNWDDTLSSEEESTSSLWNEAEISEDGEEETENLDDCFLRREPHSRTPSSSS